MPLEKQVISLDLAKELAEVMIDKGITIPKSFFNWEIGINGAKLVYAHWRECECPYYDTSDFRRNVCAYTVAELGEMLNIELTDANESESYTLKMSSAIDSWCASFGNEDGDMTPQFKDVALADCLAKMLIYLLKNNLITI